jgi:hypothetical protein
VKSKFAGPRSGLLRRCLMFILLAGLAFVSAAGVEMAAARSRGETRSKQKAEESAPPPGPLFFVISTGKQHVSVYGRNGLYTRSPVSTGRPDHPTPLGLFTIIGKERYHHSNIYSGAPMPYMQRITWSGVAMHEGVLPGYPASHGCIRMPHDFARRLFSYTEGNEHVVIARQDVVPVSISHPRLPVPKFMAMPGSGNIASSSAQMLQNAIVSVSPPGQMAGTAIVDVAVNKPGMPEAQPDSTAQKLLNPHELAKAMKARAAKQAELAGSALNPARSYIEARLKDLREAAAGVRKAEVARSNAKDRVEIADKQLQKAEGEEAVKAAMAAKAEAESKAAEAEAALALAQRTKADREQDAATAQKAYREVETTRRAAADALKSWTRRVSPISVFVSRKTQRLYVRQGFVKVFDVPVTIREPEKPLGTHLYVAMPPEQNGSGDAAALRWMVLSVPDASADSSGEQKKRRRHYDEDDAPRASGPVASASQALDRIEFPAEVEGKISEMLWAGGSLLVSDKGMSGETGDHTDFVILTR